jgi:hypothetical protein
MRRLQGAAMSAGVDSAGRALHDRGIVTGKAEAMARSEAGLGGRMSGSLDHSASPAAIAVPVVAPRNGASS